MTPRPGGRPPVLGLLLALVFWLAPGAGAMATAQELVFDGIEIREARALFPNSAAEWAPFRVELVNLGSRPRTIELRLVSQLAGRSFPVTWTVELSPGGSKRRVLPCYLGRNGWGTVFGRVQMLENGVRLTPEALTGLDFTLARGRNSKVTPMNVLIVTPERQDVSVIMDTWRSSLRRVGVGDRELAFEKIGAEEVPTAPEAYRSVHRLLLVGVDPGDLAQSQVAAIQREVRSGLTVWSLPGKGGEGLGWVYSDETGRPLSRPVLLDGEPVNHFGPVEGDRGVVRARFETDAGTTLPLVMEVPDGQGRWMRHTLAPVRDVDVVLERSERRAGGPDVHPLQSDDPSAWQRRRRSSVPGRWHEPLDALLREEVPLVSVFAILVSYLLLIGPGLFWFLKRKGKLILLLWVQPLVVLIFVVGIFVLGWIHFGAFARGFETLVVYQAPTSEWGNGCSVHTQYTATEGQRDLATGDGTLPVLIDTENARPMTWVVDSRGVPRLAGFFFPTWSYTHFASEGPLRLGPPAEAFVVEDESKLVVINHLPFPIRAPQFEDSYFAGTLEPGARREYPLTEAGSMGLTLATARPEAFWGAVRRGVLNRVTGESGDRRVLVVDFDPEDLVETPFSVTGEKRARRGILVIPVRSSR